jgi:16S rRNA (uracil1498-N3)-methyltransferase
MNSLIILPHECVEPLFAVLADERARYAFDTHGVREGQQIKIAVLGLGRGAARVLSASVAEVRLHLEMSDKDAPWYPIDLLVGVPRPQTVKKVIQAGTILGVASISFVGSDQGEKSYLQSKSLEAGEIRREVVKGLEQVWSARPPKVSVFTSLSSWYVSAPYLFTPDSGEKQILLLPHPGGEALGAVLRTLGTQPGLTDRANHPPRVVLGIGPERGWSEREVVALNERGFTTVSLGERVMRVELAVVYAIAQLQALEVFS